MEYIALSARICLCLIFFKAGISHLIGFNDMVQMLDNQGLPLPSLLSVGTIICQLGGATSLLIGYQTKIGSILLILFLIPATLVFHNPIANPNQMNAFLKNIGLIGGFLMVIYAGPGALSIDGKKSNED